jgi:hypothetical protein
MGTRLHDRQVFFKYTSLETAHLVLKSRSFRWSAPTLFNDPFDHQTGFVIDEAPTAFADFLFDSSARIIFGEEEPEPNPDSALLQAALGLRTIRHRLPKDEVLVSLRQGAMEVALKLHEHIAGFNQVLQLHLCSSRIFCVSETAHNVVMWSHYADEHRGAVFELGCIDELDNRLLAARRVEYTDKFVSFPSSKQYALHLTGEAPFDMVPLVWNIAFSKHIDWAYEREWRVHLPLLDLSAGEGHLLLEEPAPVFKSVTLGCRATDEDVANTIALVKAYLPHTAVRRAVKSKSAFKLDFVNVYAA